MATAPETQSRWFPRRRNGNNNGRNVNLNGWIPLGCLSLYSAGPPMGESRIVAGGAPIRPSLPWHARKFPFLSRLQGGLVPRRSRQSFGCVGSVREYARRTRVQRGVVNGPRGVVVRVSKKDPSTDDSLMTLLRVRIQSCKISTRPSPPFCLHSHPTQNHPARLDEPSNDKNKP